ncbi:MAG TPA: hypothetical protein GX011_03810 [Clostridiales bacterium]|jgi:O-antigen/teichoic acid export membrane protein|nr:hypothetical protein [Clostridiales bacterium]
MDKHKLIRASAAAFTAQGITAAVSAGTVLLLAGRLNAADYGLWQLYTLAGSFSGLFHLGLCDGVYLRLGGQKYENLDFGRLGCQFRLMALLQILAAAAILPPVIFLWGRSGRALSLCAALIYMPVFNAAAFLGYLLQATGRTSVYSMSTVIDRSAFVALAALAALLGGESYGVYIAVSIAAKLISLLFLISKNHRVVFAPGRVSWTQTAADISAGSRLLWGNLLGLLVVGTARIAVILRWGDAEFGRVSLAITLSGLILQFAAQLGMVIFPALRQEGGEARQRILARMRSASGLALPAVFLIYFPARLAVSAWLPRNTLEASSLVLLLPLCLFEGKTQLVHQTYLKVSRMETRLFKVNLLSAGVSIVLSFYSAFVLGSLEAVLLSAVLAAALRCFISAYPMSEAGERLTVLMELLSDLAVSAVFVCAALLLPGIAAFFVYVLFYAGFLLIRRSELSVLLPGRV